MSVVKIKILIIDSIFTKTKKEILKIILKPNEKILRNFIYLIPKIFNYC